MSNSDSSSSSSPLSIREYGRKVLNDEAAAIAAVARMLDESFDHAVKLILGLSQQAHVIVSGMGKGGIVGMKISATLASIGVPSFFLHPAEAVHGDLGRFTKSDLALILSNSGETPEVVRMLPSLKRIGCPIVSMTGNPESTLGKHSDIVLSIGRLEEAGPHGLAPTTSTTAMLALGDALAITVVSEQECSPEQFAFFHPGGELGRSLMLVSEVMRSGNELCIVPEGMIAKEVLHQITLTKGRPGAASVVDSKGKLVGIFTDGDLRRCLEREPAFLDAPIEKVMGRNPKSISAERLASEAMRVMSEYKIDQLVVIDGCSTPVGMIDIQDLIGIKL